MYPSLHASQGPADVFCETQEGLFVCPVCGGVLQVEPRWWPEELPVSTDAIEGYLSPPAEPDFCATCGNPLIFGGEPGAELSAPCEELRIEWLNRLGWPDEALEQLRRNLQVDTDTLRRRAGR